MHKRRNPWAGQIQTSGPGSPASGRKLKTPDSSDKRINMSAKTQEKKSIYEWEHSGRKFLKI